MSPTPVLKRAASEDPDASSEPPRGVKKAKKVGTMDASTTELKDTGTTETAPDSSASHGEVVLQQEDLKSSDVEENSVIEAQHPKTVAPVPEHTNEEHDSDEGNGSGSLSPDDSDDSYDSEGDDDEPYGSGLARDRDQSSAWIPNISAEDELAAEIGFADQDAAFDAYMDDNGMDAVYEEMGIASDTDDSEETTERKRSARVGVENDMDNDYGGGEDDEW